GFLFRVFRAVFLFRVFRGLCRGLRPGMRFLIHLEQLRGVHMRVALGGAEARVAEQLLDGAQVGAALEEMRRERVTQGVRTDAEPRAARRDVAPYETVHAPDGEPRP